MPLSIQCCIDVTIASIIYYDDCEDVVNFASWLWRFSNAVNTISIEYCELNQGRLIRSLISLIRSYLTSLVEPAFTTLKQNCNFNVVVSTPLQRRVLVVWHLNLTAKLSQRCMFAGKKQLLWYSVISWDWDESP